MSRSLLRNCLSLSCPTVWQLKWDQRHYSLFLSLGLDFNHSLHNQAILFNRTTWPGWEAYKIGPLNALHLAMGQRPWPTPKAVSGKTLTSVWTGRGPKCCLLVCKDSCSTGHKMYFLYKSLSLSYTYRELRILILQLQNHRPLPFYLLGNSFN